MVRFTRRACKGIYSVIIAAHGMENGIYFIISPGLGSGPVISIARRYRTFHDLLMANGDVVRRVRALGDFRVLKSYLLLLWSEWVHTDDWSGDLVEMQISIQEHFSGIGMGCHRKDLIKRLDYALRRLDFILTLPEVNGHFTQSAWEQYEQLRLLLLEVDEEAVKILSRTPPRSTRFYLLTPATCTESHTTFMCALPLPCP